MFKNKHKNHPSVRYLKIAAVVAAVFVLFMEFKRCSDDRKKNDPEMIREEVVTPEEALSRERAYYASKDFVKKAFLTTDSLEFPVYGKEQVSVTSDKNNYTVNTWVIETSGSGLSVKHEYKAEMEKIEERRWNCRSLTIDNKQAL